MPPKKKATAAKQQPLVDSTQDDHPLPEKIPVVNIDDTKPDAFDQETKMDKQQTKLSPDKETDGDEAVDEPVTSNSTSKKPKKNAATETKARKVKKAKEQSPVEEPAPQAEPKKTRKGKKVVEDESEAPPPQPKTKRQVKKVVEKEIVEEEPVQVEKPVEPKKKRKGKKAVEEPEEKELMDEFKASSENTEDFKDKEKIEKEQLEEPATEDCDSTPAEPKKKGRPKKGVANGVEAEKVKKPVKPKGRPKKAAVLSQIDDNTLEQD